MLLSKLRKKLGAKNGRVNEPTSSRSAKSGAIALQDPLAQRILPDPKSSDAEGNSNTATQPSDDAEMLLAVQARIDRAKSFGMDAQAFLDRITFDGPVSQSEVLECLRTFGLAIFPSIYDAEQLVAIECEYQDLIQNGADLARDVVAREDTPANSFALSLQRDALTVERFPETTALFGSRSVEEIAQKFFAGQSFDYNSDLFVQWTDHTDVPASGPLHWDKQLTLKSWLYVTDATEGHGAMRAGVGTAAWTRYIREDAMFDGVPYRQIVNQIREKGFPVVSTGGPAGTFFLFVTDTAHGATPVDPGKRRNIIRARSRPRRVKQWAAWASKL
ncbi:phytanoyl-CoA dioxygenase family protein [uncultured Tateyamaria sp.]|uniref:phytanoyl-CoA dioxygenase family protein n=1 Tax=uncultured Tateyamaria sp. TaxID=455651 RepID=UPI00261B0076|nr:phytanoyl-CoA dioxygenase family protein [uncultured Tateyamaria sp.]